MMADVLIRFYKWWHGRLRLKGAGLLLKLVAQRYRGLQNYPLSVPEVGVVLLDLRDMGSFMWLNYAVDGHHPEEALVTIIHALAKPGQVLWDVGANVGLISALCAGGDFGFRRIEAFEPNPALLGSLRALLKDSSCVRVHGIALGDCETKAMLNLKRGDSTRSSLVDEGEESLEIMISAGDVLIQAGQAESPDIIKVDTEGFEPQVLAGLKETILEKMPCMIFEEFSSLDSFVMSYVASGYRRFFITRDGYLTIDKNHPVRGHNGALIPPHINVSHMMV